MSGSSKPQTRRPTPPPKASETTKQTTVTTTTPSKPAQMNLVIPKDIDRRRAILAWEFVQKVTSNSAKKKHGSLARNMPTYIQVNGLAQTLAFLKAKDEAHHKWVFDSLSTLFSKLYLIEINNFDLINTIINMESQNYRLATNEALTFLQWLKRFAEAELGTEENG